ncbi:hypothetical protein [Kitasatospora sp. NPDC086791]|uniref:hypothetical protein n=1 Tax=Kitasatospora sp. NPDC086791 TaxID=3155178 RepID=UPI0034167239
MSLFDAAHYEADDMLAHPRHLTLQPVLAHLIHQLRACDTTEGGVAFQNDLRDQLLAVEKDRDGFKRAAERVRRGKAPQPGAPEPQSGRDPADLETWLFEQDVCERLSRQLRTVGDALAWRVFNFHRPFVLALARNDPPGPMYGKAGLPAELDFIDRAWKQDGAFALHHDLTNCLRIGDATVFDSESPRTVEIKTNPKKTKPVQLRRINEARAAVLHGGPMPGGPAAEVLYDLDLPLKTHLDILRTAANRAHTEGIVATEVPGSRALLVVDQYACDKLGLRSKAGLQKINEEFVAALNRAKIGRREDNIHATTMDFTARDPLRVPWASYPLDPVICARLIGDYTMFTVETNGPALARQLQASGMDARWVRPPGNGDLERGQVVMEISDYRPLRAVLTGNSHAAVTRRLQVRRLEIDRYLTELIRPSTWAAGIHHLLTMPQTIQTPWPHYRDEEQVWR